MLIGDSFPNLLFIRSTILSLRLIAPASILYCLLYPVVQPEQVFRWPFPLPISIWAISEAGFFLVAYLPRRFLLQQEVKHPEPPPKSERPLLFQRSLDSTPEIDSYVSGWFLGSPRSRIRRDNVKEFYAWSFMNKKYGDIDRAEEEELDDYVNKLEAASGQEVQNGYGESHGLRGTMESVYMQHRPLIWYLIVGLVDCTTITRLLWNGFCFHRDSLLRSVATLPVRPHALFSRSSPSSCIPYWYREHTSKTRLPVLFIHGIGVGLHTYIDFLFELNTNIKPQLDDGDIGVVAVEILPISARICSTALAGDEMRDEIRKIVDAHGWNEFILVGHSYGSAIAATILKDTNFCKGVRAAVLMDPISFLLHLPNVAYNFTRRRPTTASEHMLHYFSSQDMMISHTLARRFFWSQYILWKEDIAGLAVTVTLSGRDIIVPTKAVWQYLTKSSDGPNGSALQDGGIGGTEADETMEWHEGLLKVLWFDDFNHADLFASKGATRGVAKLVRDYCAGYVNGVSALENDAGDG